jgi:hypothetical protein
MKTFRHYFLANHFIFFVDHQALVYMVNKPFILSDITWWLLLLLEFDFEVIYKLKKEHIVPDYLSRLKTKGVTHDDVIKYSGIGLYTIHEYWASLLQHYLEIGTFPRTLN